MEQLKINLKQLIFSLYHKRQFILFIISLSSLGIIFLNLIGLSVILNQNNMYICQFLFQLICLISTGFIVTFLPCYPLFFIIFRQKAFNRLEKFSLTIIANLTLYIISTYIANFLGIPIKGYYFFLLILIVYLIEIIYIIIIERRTKTTILFKVGKLSDEQRKFYKEISILSYGKRILPLNGILIIGFLVLFSILHGVRFSYFYGTDAMYHVVMVKLINALNYLPTDQYFGALGLHLFTALIYFFTGIDHLLLAKYFSFYTFFVSGIIIYNILKRIFKNRNLAILGVLLLEFTSLGFSNMMYQFWPTSLATIQSLFIFFLLYVRLENFIKEKPPSKRDIISNLLFTYIFIVLVFISALFTHSVIAAVYIISFLFTYLIYFVKSYKRGIDFIILGFCFVLFIALLDLTDISSHWSKINLFVLPWYFLVIVGIIGFLIVLKLRSGINFEKNEFKSTISGNRHKYYKIIEDKILFPLFFSFLAIFFISFLILNLYFFAISFSKVLVLIECFIMIFFGVWGLILFQKKTKGKVLMLWLYGMALIYIGGLLLDIFFLSLTLSGRIALLMSPIFIFGFISYLYKVLKIKKVKQIKIFILCIVIFTFFAQFSDQLLDINDIEYSLHRREVYSIQWYSKYTYDSNYLICEFGIPYVVMYYSYPFDQKNKSILIDDIFSYRQKPKGYFKPSDHFYPNGTNKLKQLKETLNTDVYLLLDDNYLAFTGFDVYERLSKEEMEEYYNMNYLNKVCSSKSEDGKEFPYYWVI